MKILQKMSGHDFVVLNLTDPQLNDSEWEKGHKNREILEYTITELVQRVNPNLITVSGDLAWAGCNCAYDMFADFLNGFGIPWAPVWGNHDNQDGAEYIDGVAERYMKYSNCLYEKGEPALGNGNYIITVEEEGRPIEAIFMLDSHDREQYVNKEGNLETVYAKLTAAQGEWISLQSEELRNRGFKDATIVLHIPIYAYHQASEAAYKANVCHKELTLEKSYGNECWNEGYTESIGVQYEGIGSYPVDDGMLDIILESGVIRNIVAGHDHINNWIIRHKDVQMVYGLKCGAGCYWNPQLNGGTVFCIDENGVKNIYHEYVNVSALL